MLLRLDSRLESRNTEEQTCRQLYTVIMRYQRLASTYYSGSLESLSFMLLTTLEIWIACFMLCLIPYRRAAARRSKQDNPSSFHPNPSEKGLWCSTRRTSHSLTVLSTATNTNSRETPTGSESRFFTTFTLLCTSRSSRKGQPMTPYTNLQGMAHHAPPSTRKGTWGSMGQSD